MGSQTEDSNENCVFENNLESPTSQDEILFKREEGHMLLQGQSLGQMVFENNFDDMDQMVGDATREVDQTVNYTNRDVQKVSERESRVDTGSTSTQAARGREERLRQLRKPRQVSPDNINPLAKLRQYFSEPSDEDSEKNTSPMDHNLVSSGGLRLESEPLSLTMDSSRGLVEGGELQNRTIGRSSQFGISPHSQAGPNNFGGKGREMNVTSVAGHAPEQDQMVVRQGKGMRQESGAGNHLSNMPVGFGGGLGETSIMFQHQSMMGGAGQTGGGVSGNVDSSQFLAGFGGGQRGPSIISEYQAMMDGVGNTGGGVSGNVNSSPFLAGFGGGRTGPSIMSEYQAMMSGAEGTEGGVSGGVSQTFTRYVEGQRGAYYMSQAQTQTIISREGEMRGEGNDPSQMSQMLAGFGRGQSGANHMPQFQNHTTLGGGQEGTDYLSRVQNQTITGVSGGGGESVSSLMTFPGAESRDRDLLSQAGTQFEDMDLDNDKEGFMNQLNQLLGYEVIKVQVGIQATKYPGNHVQMLHLVKFISHKRCWLCKKRARNNKSPRSEGMCTVIILDTSSCMSGEPISEAGQFISKFLDGLEEAQFEHGLDENVAIICASEGVHVLQHLTTDYVAVRRAVDTVYAEGRSQLQFAIMLPLSVLILDPQRGIDYIGKIHSHRICPRIILITDGHPAARRDIPGQESPVVEERDAVMFQTFCFDMLDDVRKRTLCDVYCVPVGNANTKFLSDLAAIGGGCLIENTDARKLSRAFLHHYVVGNLLKMDVDISDRAIVAAVVQSTLNCSDEQDVSSVMEILSRGEPELEARDREIAEVIQKGEQEVFGVKGSRDGRGLKGTGTKESKGQIVGYTNGSSDFTGQGKVGTGKRRPDIIGRADIEQTEKQDPGRVSRVEQWTGHTGESEGIYMNGFGDVSDLGIDQTRENCESNNVYLDPHTERPEYELGHGKNIVPHEDSLRTSNSKSISKSPNLELFTSTDELQSLGLGLVNVDNSEEDENLYKARTVNPEHGLNNKFGSMELRPSPDETTSNVKRSQKASPHRALLEMLRQRKQHSSHQSSLSKSTYR